MTGSRFRANTCATILALAALVPPFATAQAAYQLDVRAQDLGDALRAVGRQTNTNVIFEPSLVKGLNAGTLRAELTADQAIQQLLVGTRLAARRTSADTVVVQRAQEPTSAPASGNETSKANKEAQDKSFWDRFRLAQADQGPTPVASAPDHPDQTSVTLEEIVVTAQKREERLQDVPISISVLGGKDLDRSSLVSVADALNQVPGVVTTVAIQGGGTQAQIRGVGASGPLFNGSSPIGYYLDSVPFGLIQSAVAPDQNPYDLQRIEVLRGPQGTLYGAGGEGGVVRILTNDANLDEFQLTGRVTLSDTKDGGANYGGDIAANVPIVEGRLGARVVLGYQDLSGWVDGPSNDNVNDAVLRNYRLKLNAQPTDRLSVGLSAWSVRNDNGAQSASTEDRRTEGTFGEPITTDYDAYGFKVGYDFSSFSLSSMTSYFRYENTYQQDATRFGLPGLVILFDQDADILSQEVILSSTADGVWRWTLGAFYRDAEETKFQSIPPGTFFYIDETYGSKSQAVFGEITRLFLDGELELTAGLRYFRDEVLTKQNSVFPPSSDPLYRAEDTFDAIKPRVVLAWHPSADLTVYGSMSEGFRSGTPQNASVQQVVDLPSVEPDSLSNYEFGARGSFWNGRVSLDAALYFIDWDDVQQTLGVPFTVGGVTTCCIIAPVNGEAASGPGVDVGVTLKPVDRFEFGGTFSWNDLTIDESIVSNDIVVFAKGDRLNYSSEYTGSVFANYEFPLGTQLTGRFSASANYSSEQVNRLLGSGPATVLTGDDFLIARASFVVEAARRWTAMVYVDNLTDESGGVPGTAPAPDLTPRLRPRTVGVQLNYEF